MSQTPQWRTAWEASKEQPQHQPAPAAKVDPLAEMLGKLDQSKPLASYREIPEALKVAFERSGAIRDLRELLTDPVMREFLPLMNTPLGFRCDRPNKRNQEPYSIDEVRNVFVQALLWGLPLVGNMFNIIAGQCYITVDGFGYLLKQLEASEKKVTDLEIIPDIPRRSTGGAVVPFRATWRQNGTEQCITSAVPVRTDEHSTVDQTLGKALRKIRARVYQVITGTTFTRDGDVEEMEDDLAQQETAKGGRGRPAPTPGPIQPLSAAPTPQAAPTPAAEDPAEEPKAAPPQTVWE